MPAEPPALDAAAGDVARADDDVGALVERADEVGEVTDVVGEVRVHLEEAVVALFEALLERLDVRRPETELARAVHHLDVLVLRRDRVREVTRPVGRVVVDDQQVRLGEGSAHRLDEAGEVVLLVVRRGDDEGTGHGRGEAGPERPERD